MQRAQSTNPFAAADDAEQRFGAFFAKLDARLGGSGAVDTAHAAEFFQKSKLPPPTLAAVWQRTVGSAPSLDRAVFCTMCAAVDDEVAKGKRAAAASTTSAAAPGTAAAAAAPPTSPQLNPFVQEPAAAAPSAPYLPALLQQAFDEADVDNDGRLSSTEGATFLRRSGLADAVLATVWSEARGEGSTGRGLGAAEFGVAVGLVERHRAGWLEGALTHGGRRLSRRGSSDASSVAEAINAVELGAGDSGGGGADAAAAAAAGRPPDELDAGLTKRVVVYVSGDTKSGGKMVSVPSEAQGGVAKLLEVALKKHGFECGAEEVEEARLMMQECEIDEVDVLRDGDKVQLIPSDELSESPPTPSASGSFAARRRRQLSVTALWEIGREELELGAQLGEGNFGGVFRAQWRGTAVAVKQLNANFGDSATKAADDIHEFRKEISLMGMLRHPNIVLFLGAVTKPPGLMLVTEYVAGGDLFAFLADEQVAITSKEKVDMALDVCRGMAYLHGFEPPLLHRDLKSSNLLVDPSRKLKICDFGFARVKASRQKQLSAVATGTPQWMAPEVLSNEPFTEKADVYSFAIVLWELLSRQRPWSGKNPAEIAMAVTIQDARPVLPEDAPAKMAELARRCWVSRPEQRPRFEDLTKELSAFRDTM